MQRTKLKTLYSLYAFFFFVLFCAFTVTSFFSPSFAKELSQNNATANATVFAAMPLSLEAPFIENTQNVTDSHALNAKKAVSTDSDTYRFCVLLLFHALLLFAMGACVRFFTQKAFIHDIKAFIAHTIFLQTVK